jgi:hypothetical protein
LLRSAKFPGNEDGIATVLDLRAALFLEALLLTRFDFCATCRSIHDVFVWNNAISPATLVIFRNLLFFVADVPCPDWGLTWASEKFTIPSADLFYNSLSSSLFVMLQTQHTSGMDSFKDRVTDNIPRQSFDVVVDGPLI